MVERIMNNNIGLNYINNAIDELISLLGIKEDVPMDTILEPLSTKNIKGCVEKIANYLGLPVVVNISYVPGEYQRNSRNRFDSSGLSTTDRSGRGVGGIIAQVSIPSYLPLYGTPGLKGFPINVKISDNCLENIEAFITIMAHELSHIVLHSLLYKEKDNEIYTDLTAMILGFSLVILGGRKNVEHKNVQTKNHVFYSETKAEKLTTTYGYLSDEQAIFAFNKIDKILKKCTESKEKLVKRLPAYEILLISYKKELTKFNNFIEYLDKNQDKRIRSEDVAKIVEFHQLDYIERFREVIRHNEEKLKEISDFCLALVHYTRPQLNSLQILDKGIDSLLSNLQIEFDVLNSDVSTLKGYVGFFHKLNITN